MNELQSLASEIAKLKKTGRKTIPLLLKEQIVKTIERSDLPVGQAANILNLHAMTFYKWRRYLKRKADVSRKTPRPVIVKKNRKRIKDDFIEILPSAVMPPSVNTSLSNGNGQLFLEIDLGKGMLMRLYR